MSGVACRRCGPNALADVDAMPRNETMRDETGRDVASHLASYCLVCAGLAYLLPDQTNMDHVVHITLLTCAFGEGAVAILFLLAMMLHGRIRDHDHVDQDERDFGAQLAPHITELLDRQQRGQTVEEIHQWLVDSTR